MIMFILPEDGLYDLSEGVTGHFGRDANSRLGDETLGLKRNPSMEA
jgi:hypothetical protein